MKHHLTFLSVVFTLALIFVLTSTATAQDLLNFYPTGNDPHQNDGKREGLFFIPQKSVFQAEGKVYIYANALNSTRKDSTDIVCTISTNTNFETFRMVTEVKECRLATKADLIFAKTRKSLLFVPVGQKAGYNILINVKSQEDIDAEHYQDDIERANDLISKSIYSH